MENHINRENGYYWCKLDGKWDIFTWCNAWYDGMENSYKETEFQEIKEVKLSVDDVEENPTKIQIAPFRMKIDEQVEGIDVIAFLSRNGIGLQPNFSYPFNLIIYKGGDEFLTMTDEWVWGKYETIPIVSYSGHKLHYSY